MHANSITIVEISKCKIYGGRDDEEVVYMKYILLKRNLHLLKIKNKKKTKQPEYKQKDEPKLCYKWGQTTTRTNF